MSQGSAAYPGALARVSVPAEGELRAIVPGLVAKIAEFLGQNADEATLGSAIDSVAQSVTPKGPDAQIEFVVRQADGDLLIEAHSGGKSSEVRCPLAV